MPASCSTATTPGIGPELERAASGSGPKTSVGGGAPNPMPPPAPRYGTTLVHQVETGLHVTGRQRDGGDTTALPAALRALRDVVGLAAYRSVVIRHTAGGVVHAVPEDVPGDGHQRGIAAAGDPRVVAEGVDEVVRVVRAPRPAGLDEVEARRIDGAGEVARDGGRGLAGNPLPGGRGRGQDPGARRFAVDRRQSVAGQQGDVGGQRLAVARGCGGDGGSGRDGGMRCLRRARRNRRENADGEGARGHRRQRGESSLVQGHEDFPLPRKLG
jgi:hypothetical protein